jgi:hypothetical protein
MQKHECYSPPAALRLATVPIPRHARPILRRAMPCSVPGHVPPRRRQSKTPWQGLHHHRRELPTAAGRGHRRCHISGVSDVSDVCFKCFIWMSSYVALAIYVCCKRMFHAASICIKCFRCFQAYVLSVSSGCCIYMHVASVCFKVFQVFHTHIVSVLSWCCICSQWLSNVVQVVLQVFQLLRMYVAIVLFRCCKRRSCVAHVPMGPICRSRLL